MKSKFLFYLLSLTWGLLQNVLGGIAALVLLAFKHKPKKFGYCYCFELGQCWGGFSLGMFSFVDKDNDFSTEIHEHGHAWQNCIFGPFTFFIITMPSVIRYHYRNLRKKIGKPCTTDYYSIWFEKQANEFGEKFMNWYNTN